MNIPHQQSINNVPQELTKIPQWICWKKQIGENGKIDKIPISPKTGSKCDVTDHKSYASFAVALACLKKHPGEVDGIGFCLTKDIHITGLDVDYALDDNGISKAPATDILVLRFQNNEQ